MARFLPAVLAFLVAGPAVAQPIEWLPEQLSAAGFGPDSAVDPIVGSVHVVFVQSSWVRHLVLSAGGSVSLDETDASWSGESDALAGGPAVAEGPGSEVHLVWKSDAGQDEWNLWYARRTTSTWGTPVMLNQAVLFGWAPQAAADDEGVTVVATGSTGAWPEAEVRAWRIENGTSQGVSLGVLPARSDDRIDVVAGPAPGERHLFSGIPDQPGEVRWARSTSSGATWTDMGAIHSSGCAGVRVGQPDAAVAPDGSVHVVYGCAGDSQAGGGPSVRHALIEGSSVVADSLVSGPGQVESWTIGVGIGRVAVSDMGTVCVAWLSRPGGALWASSSDDRGATWQEAEQLASVAGAADGRDAHALSASGRVFFLFWPDGTAVHFRRGLGPVVTGDDDDTTPDDDDSTPDDDSAADDDDLVLDDDDSSIHSLGLGGCCDGDDDWDAASAGPAAALLLLSLLPVLRRRDQDAGRRSATHPVCRCGTAVCSPGPGSSRRPPAPRGGPALR